jgi:hypothetical protein
MQPVAISPMSSPSALPVPKRTRMVKKSVSRSLAKRFQEIAPNLTDSQPSNSPSLIPLPISNLQSPNARVNPSQAPIILPALKKICLIKPSTTPQQPNLKRTPFYQFVDCKHSR